MPRTRPSAFLLAALLLMTALVGPAPAAADTVGAAAAAVDAAGADEVTRFDATLSGLFERIRALRVAPQRDGLPDLRPATVAARRQALATLDRELAGLLPTARALPRSQQVDFLLVRGAANQLAWELVVARPWARDPGFHVDPLLRAAFVELPASGAALTGLQTRLQRIPAELDRARTLLDDVAGDYARLALHNLDHADGVGHGHPWRAVPPDGVLGWYRDLAARAHAAQPELLPDIEAAQTAIAAFRDWLQAGSADLSAPAGVGAARFDWYLRHVARLPWTADQLEVLGQREFDRLSARLALERRRNRDLPVLGPAATREDYHARIADADRHIRDFIAEQDLLSVPAHVGQLGTNVPWIVRPGGRNFWEEVQYRDPRPDHLHAVIPGHRFDLLLASAIDHPIRGHIRDGIRVEGWAYYVEEAFEQLGLLEQRPRTRELFHLFGIKRATRVHVDIQMQRNLMGIEQATDYMVERVPMLDRAVARVDAEIYLRRPPGYGLGYLVGKLQMEALLADQARQLGDHFDLKAFHDHVLSAGLIPIALLRYELTGLDDEMAAFWDQQPL